MEGRLWVKGLSMGWGRLLSDRRAAETWGRVPLQRAAARYLYRGVALLREVRAGASWELEARVWTGKRKRFEAGLQRNGNN